MAQLQVIVNKLNIRTHPVLDFADKSNVVGVLLQDAVFESVGEIENGLGKWFVDRDGNWASEKWLGDLLIPIDQIKFDVKKMSWGHQLYDIPSIWNQLKTKGVGITVGVVDTGVDFNHPDLEINIHSLSKSFIGDPKNFSDMNGHGTEMAGIIAAKGTSSAYGIAPDAKLLIVKASSSGDQNDLVHFVDALNYISDIPEVDVISISYAFICSKFDEECNYIVEKFHQAINRCLDANKIIVSSIGDNHFPGEIDRDTYPSAFNSGIPYSSGVIGIGSFNQSGNLCDFSQWNPHLCLIAPGDSIWTTGLNDSGAFGLQTSIAAAFTAGCVALILSYMKKNNKLDPFKCINAILNSCDQIGSKNTFDIQSGYGKLNLNNAIDKIKK